MNKKITLFLAVAYCNFVHGAFVENLGNLNSQLNQLTTKSISFLSQPLPKGIHILDDTINRHAPSKAQLEDFAEETGIEVVQLVVAWQDLSAESFIAEPGVINPITQQLNTQKK